MVSPREIKMAVIDHAMLALRVDDFAKQRDGLAACGENLGHLIDGIVHVAGDRFVRTFDRAAFEAMLQRALDEKNVELICLGGFMRLFTAEFVRRWYGSMLNIHPSLLPSFPGLDPHGQALRAGVKLSGATVHFVIPETDAGPIVMQGAVTVADDDTPETLAAHVIKIEHRIYPEALRLVASGQVRLDGDICRTSGSVSSDGVLISPATGNTNGPED